MGHNEEMAEDACLVWHAVIQADIHTWKSVANENCMAVGGMSEEELIRHVQGTAFVDLVCDFVTSATAGEKMQNVGFLNDQVRDRVSHSFGSGELAKVLALSAKIAYATASSKGV